MPRNIYKLKDGAIVPGVTTIINQLDKPALLDWAWRLGKEGKDWREERDSAGDIGTLVHEAVLHFLTNESVDFKDSTVSKCFGKFLHWWDEETTRLGKPTIIVEQAMVSEKYGFGGQPDIFAVEWERRIDVKTSSGVYESYWYQLAGYDLLGIENGQKATEHQILWLPKDDRFDAPIRKELKREKEIFKHLLKICYLRREGENPSNRR